MSKFFRAVSPTVNYDFIGYCGKFFFISGLAMLASIILIGVRGLNFGIDFSGGTEVQIQFVACDDDTASPTAPPKPGTSTAATPIKTKVVCVKRSELKSSKLRLKIKELFPQSDPEVQPVGNDGTEFMLKFQEVSFVSEAQTKTLQTNLQKAFVRKGQTASDLIGFRFRSEGGSKVDLTFNRALVLDTKKDATKPDAAKKDTANKPKDTPKTTASPKATTQPTTQPGKTTTGITPNPQATQDAQIAAWQKLSDTERIKQIFTHLGLKDVEIEVGASQGGQFEYMVSFEGLSATLQAKLQEAFGAGAFKIEQVESVGPRVGKKLRNDGVISLLLANLFILIYIAIRFDFRYAPGAVAALIHDILITAGVFAALQIPFDLTIIAALLTIIGYSLNDTIVVYDRIRENWEKSKVDFAEIINRSINETLSRTLLTSGTTFLAVLPIYLIGGVNIKWFAFAMMFGILVGTYSSIAVASPLVHWLDQYFTKQGREEDAEQEAKRERRRRRRAGLDETPENA